MSELKITAWDRELNAAVAHIGTKLLPRGFSVVEHPGQFLVAGESAWERFDRDGRPSVSAVDAEDGEASLFGEKELSEVFLASMAVLMFGRVGKRSTDPNAIATANESKETHEAHKPDICPGMVGETLTEYLAELTAAYGDNEKTDIWSRALILLWIDRTAALILFGHEAVKDTQAFVTQGVEQSFKLRQSVDDLLDSSMRMYMLAMQVLSSSRRQPANDAESWTGENLTPVDATGKPTLQ